MSSLSNPEYLELGVVRRTLPSVSDGILIFVYVTMLFISFIIV